MNLLDLTDPESRIFPKILRKQAEMNGDTEFLVGDEIRITYAEAESITNALAGGLAKLGVEKGDRVALFMGSRPEMVLLTLAINKLGAIWIPICTDYKGEWLIDTLKRSRTSLLITDSEFQDRIVSIRDPLGESDLVVLEAPGVEPPTGARSYAELLQSEPLVSDYADQHQGDTCAVLWTSGTTGKSKGVMQSYYGWIRPIVKGGSAPYESRAGDVIYCALPLFHSGAWVTTVYRALIEGITCAIEPRFSVTRFWQRVEEFGATQTFVIGAMGVFLWNAPESSDDAETPLRVAGIVPMPPELWSRFEKRFGVKLVRSGLGQSEILVVMTQVEKRADVPTYALGFPPDDIEIRLCDEDGNDVPVGQPGEICVRPLEPYVLFNGYFDDPEATARAYRDESFLTGDVARQDPETGAYFFVDRKKDVVRFAGRNLSTMEVESVVRGHPAVRDVAAFGIQSEEVESEHELKLNVVREPGGDLTPEELCGFINQNAPYYFVPRYVEFVDALPYTPTNKVQKFELRKAGVTGSTWDLKRSDFEVQR
jgi:crotonobetaine/carnitine-CoA ligase